MLWWGKAGGKVAVLRPTVSDVPNHIRERLGINWLEKMKV
jgi:hypothetical protein